MHCNHQSIAIGFALLLLGCSLGPNHESAINQDRVSIRDAVVTLEIVSTLAQQQRGLGQRDGLDWNHGMLFVYDEPRFISMWMKDMRFDIDIVWIRDGRIVDIAHRVPHRVKGPLPIYSPREFADSVLEVPAGYAQAHGWQIGDPVLVQRAKSTRSERSLLSIGELTHRIGSNAVLKSAVEFARFDARGLVERLFERNPRTQPS